MRPFVSSSVVLAAVSLLGVAVAGPSPRSAAGDGEVRTAGFHAPPPGLSFETVRRRAVQLDQDPAPQERAQEIDLPPAPHEFFFTRAIYSDYRSGFGGWGGRRGSWAIDFPKADQQFLIVLQRLIDIDAYDRENPIRLDDPALRRYPFLYALEVGRMDLGEDEIHGLRDYLNAGGFLVIDDFWGPHAWANFQHQISRVIPGRSIVDLPPDHSIFNTFYDIREVLQVPNIGNGRRGDPAGYSECPGCTPAVRGIFDDHGRLMVVINFNTDLGDAWEWSEDPWYPLDRSTFAYQMGINMIVYAMSR